MSMCEKCGLWRPGRPALWAFFTLADDGRPAIRRFCQSCSDTAERLVLAWLEEKEPVRADVPAGP